MDERLIDTEGKDLTKEIAREAMDLAGVPVDWIVSPQQNMVICNLAGGFSDTFCGCPMSVDWGLPGGTILLVDSDTKKELVRIINLKELTI